MKRGTERLRSQSEGLRENMQRVNNSVQTLINNEDWSLVVERLKELTEVCSSIRDLENRIADLDV